MSSETYTVTKEDLENNEYFASLGFKVGEVVPFNPAVVISRDEAKAQGIDVDRVEYEARVAELRTTMLGIEETLLGLTKGIPESVGQAGAGEVAANLELAYRHAEDVRMRLGKVFQSLNNGVSNNTR